MRRLAISDDDSEAKVSTGRLLAVGVVVVLMIFSLVGRLWFLQILHGRDNRLRAEENQRRRTRTVPPRGVITDRNGVVLATNSARYALYAVPSQLPPPPKKGAKGPDRRRRLLENLGEIVDMDPKRIEAAIRKNRGVATDPALVATPITMRKVARFVERADRFPGFLVQVEPVRRYPLKSVAAHVIGYTQPVNASDLADASVRARYRNTDYMGRTGVERSYDAELAGLPGGTFFEVDRLDRGMRTLSVQEPRPGATVALSIDVNVQKAAEAALAGRKGAVVAIDPATGEVLALASTPAYDLNLWSVRPMPPSLYRSRIEPFSSNHAVQDQLPPGSTMKIVTLAAGLGTGRITSYTTVHCTGGLQFKGKARLGCTGTHGWTSLYPAFASSCNAYFGQMGIWVGHESMAKWAARFGLGVPTGIDLPGEHDGNVDGPRTQEAIYRRFGKEYSGWYHGDSANMAIGQGGMLVTPVQLAVVAAAVANGGAVVEPTVVHRIQRPDGGVEERPVDARVRGRIGLDADSISILRRAMGEVVYSSAGTSRAAQLPGIEVRGKSGSAESRGKGSPTHAWFVCYAGKRGGKPALAVSVWLDAAGKHLHGGSHAAPIARKVIARYFGVVDRGPLTAAAVRD